MTSDRLSMHPLSLRFEDPALELDYVAEQERKARRPRRLVALVAAVAVALVWLMLSLGVHLFPIDKYRVAAWSSVFLVLAALYYWLEGALHFEHNRAGFHLLFFPLITAFVIGLVSLLPPGPLAISGLALVVIHTLNSYGLLRLRFPAATAGGWLMAATYLVYLLADRSLAMPDVLRHAFWLGTANIFGMLMSYQLDVYARREFIALRALAAERERSERLLLNILPPAIAARLKSSDASIADHSEEVTVLFADIVGFTPLSARLSPQAVVTLLDRIFTEFDSLAELHGLEKIKTIGDCYMAASGLPERRSEHAQAAARMAQGMLEAVSRIAAETREALSVRIGLNSGPVVAGVIGRRKFSYDLWGDTVNTASRMESHGVPGTVHCTSTTAALLRGTFGLRARGVIEVDGKGTMHTFFLEPLGEPMETAAAGTA